MFRIPREFQTIEKIIAVWKLKKRRENAKVDKSVNLLRAMV